MVSPTVLEFSEGNPKISHGAQMIHQMKTLTSLIDTIIDRQMKTLTSLCTVHNTQVPDASEREHYN